MDNKNYMISLKRTNEAETDQKIRTNDTEKDTLK